MMQFGAAALADVATRLWLSDFLPRSYREAGFAQFVKDMMEPSFPPVELKQIAILDMNGTLRRGDPAANRGRAPRGDGAVRPQVLRVARLEGMHHYLFTQESIKVVGTCGCGSSSRAILTSPAP